MKQLFLFGTTIFFGFMIGCNAQEQDKLIKNKNICYDASLQHLKGEPLYSEVMSRFVDTFRVMKNDTPYFGIPEVEKKIDEAIFFNKKKTKCLLLVLKKNNFNLVFGMARVIRGELKGNQWFFKVSTEYVYSNSYYGLYDKNNFENISTLARYSILIEGDARKKGCEIDENYWFVLMEK